MKEYDCTLTSEAICPFCGYENSDSWEMEDREEVECECGGTYNVVRDIDVSYSSYPKKEPGKE